MASQIYSGFVYDDSGVAVNGATIDLYDVNTTTPSRANTTTNASGYWTISHATEGRFDVKIVNGSSTRWIKYDDEVQLTTVEVANFNIRNPADTFDYSILPAAITADRILTLPLITATDTLAVLGLAQAFTQRQLWAKGADLASGATITPGTDGNFFDITGTTTITAIASLQAGSVVVFQFDGALTLTHNATSLILKDAINMTTAAGDVVVLISEGSGNWRELFRTAPIKLDDLDAPDDNTDLDATTSLHGLLLKLGGGTTNFLRADGTWNVPSGTGPSQSTQAAIEAETNEDTYPPPDLIKHSPGVAKAWANFTAGGVLDASYNVSSITDSGVGDWTVNLTTAMSSSNYAVLITIFHNLPADTTIDQRRVSETGTRGTTSFAIIVHDDQNPPARKDPDGDIHAVAFGDQ